ncbi:TPA: hypothetical protein JA361_08485 [Legionella pneumophila]|nr:hypothetical protein [Legionella pneumophila]HAT8182951.1 hypothetical protein [Legionella pneumophila]
MAINRFFDDCCPEAKLIFALAIIGCVSGALIRTTIATDENKSFIASDLSFSFFGIACGLIIGKVTGTVARSLGVGFFWKKDEQQNALNEEKATSKITLEV